MNLLVDSGIYRSHFTRVGLVRLEIRMRKPFVIGVSATCLQHAAIGCNAPGREPTSIKNGVVPGAQLHE